MPETTPLIKAALNLRVGAGFDVYLAALAVVDPPQAVNPVITIAAVNTAHITFVFTWGKFHLLIFSFLLFH